MFPLHVDLTRYVAHKMIVQCVYVHLECLVLLQIAVQSVIFIKIAHLTELAFNKDVRILALVHVALMLFATFIITNQFALASMGMKGILILVAMFVKVSATLQFHFFICFCWFCKCLFSFFQFSTILYAIRTSN